MQQKTIETIVIGGGISGLSCAKRLHKAKKDFLVISKDIGGRMKASESFVANYGAAYITEDYHNVLKYVKKGEPMKIKDFYFYTGEKFTNIFSLRNAKFYLKMLKLLYTAWKVRKHLKIFRKKAPYKSMNECFEEDPFLLKYWLMPAKDFVKKNKLEAINHYIIDPVTAATAFVKSNKVNTIYFLSMIFPVFLKTWIVDFSGTIEKLTKGFEKKIKLGEVKKVTKNKDGKYEVKTTTGNFITKNVVFAAPYNHLKKVYTLPKTNIQQDSYVFHVDGEQKKKFADKKAIVFQDEYYDIHMLWRQSDNTDIIYTQHSSPNLSRYYKNYRIIKKIHWKPAMVIPTCCVIDQILDKNLYLASDFNASGLEDSFLSGLYAANQIIKKSRKTKKYRNKISQQNSKNTVSDHVTKHTRKNTTDPICKMHIKGEDTLSISHEGKKYFFCGKTCMKKFQNDIRDQDARSPE